MSVGPLGRQRRLVLERELALSRGRDDLAAARVRFSGRLRAELARPAVLLAFFAAGVGYGFLRKPFEDGDAEAAGDEESAARLARTSAAFLAAARLLQHALRAAAVLGPTE